MYFMQISFPKRQLVVPSSLLLVKDATKLPSSSHKLFLKVADVVDLKLVFTD